MEKIKILFSKPLNIILLAIIVLFLIFSGGAISITLKYGGLMGTGWESGISWMWIPSLLFLTLSIILGRMILDKNNDSDN